MNYLDRINRATAAEYAGETQTADAELDALALAIRSFPEANDVIPFVRNRLEQIPLLRGSVDSWVNRITSRVDGEIKIPVMRFEQAA